MTSTPLPAGQQVRDDFPRFGLPVFAKYQATFSEDYAIVIGGDVDSFTITRDDLNTLQRVNQVSDFHCVTTWSYQRLRWSGFRLKDVYETLILPRLAPNTAISLIAFRAHDKRKSSLILEDALGDDVLLADSLNDAPLTFEHGAPLRVVAPAHYGYKNVKHLHKIEVWRDADSYHPPKPLFLEHPRGRVAVEERGRYLPGWFYRYLYRPFIGYAVRLMRQNKP